MKPKERSINLLAQTRSKVKQYEYGIPEEEHIGITKPLINLIDITLGILGDIAGEYKDIDNKIDEKVDLEDLFFSAKYFDAILNSRTVDDLSDYLKILAASAYYLVGFPGSSSVIIKSFKKDIDLEANNLEKLIAMILSKEKIKIREANSNPYSKLITKIFNDFFYFHDFGTNVDKLISEVKELKNLTRAFGTSRELLFGDIINAICINYLKHSTWINLPKYSNLEISKWKKFIERKSFLKEFWPAQIIIGEKGVFKGNSSIIQMPTGSGKTKSTELIIRSSFLSGRSKNALIVAPLRALCQEIYETLNYSFSEDINISVDLTSDAMQFDFYENNETNFNVTILTPEKLDYILRQKPKIAEKFNLIIYDEGHLFDNNLRGVKYELLLSSLKRKLNKEAQVVLISAIISNPIEIGKWLIGNDFTLVQATSILPINRSIGFVSLSRKQMIYVNDKNIEEEEFFVPKVIEKQELALLGRERRKRFFPENKPGQVALYLGFRLIKNGTVAIFVGQKRSTLTIAREAIEAFKRGLVFARPYNYSKKVQLDRLNKYIESILGLESIHAEASKLGIYIHSGSTPQGLRLAIEYALIKRHINFIVCTSTLAQGVNLPIKYLIIASSRQGKNEMKVRDFHNLIGRVGRAGIYTEGSVLFANNKIFDRKIHWQEKYFWIETKKLLDINESEHCKSYILSYFKQKPADGEINEWELNRENIENEIERYLLDEIDDLSYDDNFENYINDITINTLAYNQANDNVKEKLKALFKNIAIGIINKEESFKRRKVFSKAIVSLADAKEVLDFLYNEVLEFNKKNANELLELLWPIIFRYQNNLPKGIDEETLLVLCKAWVKGKEYFKLFDLVSDIRIGRTKMYLDKLIDICDKSLSFEGSFIIGSCVELLDLIESGNDSIKNELRLLQKMLKYGLPSRTTIIINELGFNDRKLCIDIEKILNIGLVSVYKARIIESILNNKDRIKSHISINFPLYYEDKFDRFISKHRR
jgi:POLQ-like helicase